MFQSPCLRPLLRPRPTYSGSVFDGTNDYAAIVGGAINNTMPSTTDWTLGITLRKPSTGARTYFQLTSLLSGLIINVRQAASGNLVLAIDDPVNWGGGAVNIVPGAGIPIDGKYHTFYLGAQYDGLQTLFTPILDNAPFGSPGLNSDGPIDFSQADSASIGATTTGTQKFNGGICEIGLWPGFVLSTDIMNSDNSPTIKPNGGRRIAYDYLGNATVVAPMIWCQGGGNDIAINRAPGGHDFIVVGSMTSETVTV